MAASTSSSNVPPQVQQMTRTVEDFMNKYPKITLQGMYMLSACVRTYFSLAVPRTPHFVLVSKMLLFLSPDFPCGTFHGFRNERTNEPP